MSKVLYLLDYREHLSFEHEYWLDEQYLKQCEKDLGLQATKDEADFCADDIPF